MKKLLAIATVLLATTAAAQAQYTFDYGGRTIRIDPDRGTVQIPGVYDNTPRKAKRAKTDESEPKRKQTPQQANTDSKSDPQAAPVAPAAPAPTTATAPAVAPAPTAATTPPVAPAPAPAEQAAVPPAPPPPPPPPPAAAATTPPEPATTTAAVAPSDTAAAPPPPAPPAAPAPQEAAPVARPAPAATVAVAPPSPPPAPKAAVAANSPVGVWLTEQKEGKVRIEQCGNNLCGYAVDKKSNGNGEQILINMKPGQNKWSGRIFDPNSGSTYDSTIALKNTDTLRVQGCAFGGMFCGGQTWTRVN